MITAPMSSPRPSVAIIRNYSTTAEWGQAMLDSISILVRKSVPDASIEHFHPIDGSALPEASSFDLVILTGGTLDLTVTEIPPWAEQITQWVRDTVAKSPRTKLLGFCWGHQVISRAMGGQIVHRTEGSLIDVETIRLTSKGQVFFDGSKLLHLHKFHKRVISHSAPEFDILGDNFEILLSRSSQILTFQSHPEMTEDISRAILDNADASYRPSSTTDAKEKLYRDIAKNHDGQAVFKRAMQWAFNMTQ